MFPARLLAQFLRLTVVMSESTKRRKTIIEYGQGKHVSAKALAAILQDVRDDGLPDAMSASAYNRYRAKAVYAKTSFGPVISQHELKLKDGGVRNIPFAHHLALLEWAIRNEPGFHRLFREVCDQNDNKLGVVLYSDEVTPGQALIPDNRRITAAL